MALQFLLSPSERPRSDLEGDVTAVIGWSIEVYHLTHLLHPLADQHYAQTQSEMHTRKRKNSLGALTSSTSVKAVHDS